MEDYEQSYRAYAAEMERRKRQHALLDLQRKYALEQWLFFHARWTDHWAYIDNIDVNFPVPHTITELHDAVDKLVELGIIENENGIYKRIRRVDLLPELPEVS